MKRNEPNSNDCQYSQPFRQVRVAGQKRRSGKWTLAAAWEFVDFFQPTIQPTEHMSYIDFRVVWQSPRFL